MKVWHFQLQLAANQTHDMIEKPNMSSLMDFLLLNFVILLGGQQSDALWENTIQPG